MVRFNSAIIDCLQCFVFIDLNVFNGNAKEFAEYGTAKKNR